MTDTWQHLRFYESARALRHAASRVGYDLPSLQADEILSCFQLARDYYGAAATGYMTIRPVLLFYGMTNLAKGLILLFGGRERRSLRMLQGSHGVKFVQGIEGRLETFGCRAEGAGTFVDFLKTFACDLQFAGLIPGRLKNANAEEVSDHVFTFADLAGWFPKLEFLYRKTFSKAPLVVDAHIEVFEGRHTLHFYGTGAPEGWQARVPADFKDNTDLSPPHWISSHSPFDQWFSWVDIGHGGSGWPHGVEAAVEYFPERTRHLSPWAALFAGMFTLSMIVRYQPKLWIDLTTPRGDRETLALVEAFVTHAESIFPLRAVEFLEKATPLSGYITTLDHIKETDLR